MPILRSLLIGLVSVAALSGCGGSSSSSSPAGGGSSSSAGGGAAAAASCGVAPASMVNAALGTSVSAPSQTGAGNAVACEYKGTKGDVVVVRIQTDASAASFAAERKGFETTSQPTKDYPGFGDEAFTNTKKMPLSLPDVNTLVARQGAVEVLVSASASISAERTLVQQIFAKVK